MMVMITKEKALQIAQKAAEEKIASSPDRLARKYSSAELSREYNEALEFFISCPELLSSDYAPGGFFVFVDKMDGHVWNKKEIEAFFAARAVKEERRLEVA
jgi:hypothetical protein